MELIRINSGYCVPLKIAYRKAGRKVERTWAVDEKNNKGERLIQVACLYSEPPA